MRPSGLVKRPTMSMASPASCSRRCLLRRVEDAVENPFVNLVNKRLAMGKPPGRTERRVDTFLLALGGDNVLFQRDIPALVIILGNFLEIGSREPALGKQGAVNHAGAVGAERMQFQVPYAIDGAAEVSAGIEERRIGAAAFAPALKALDFRESLRALQERHAAFVLGEGDDIFAVGLLDP